MRIVVGYDGSAPAARALDRAATLAGPDGEVVVVSALPSEPPLLRPGIPFDPEEVEEQDRELAAAAERLGTHRVRATLLRPVGDPGEALVAAARERAADLVVVGTGGRGAAARLLLGSVSTHVVHHAPCDVYVVR